MKLLEEILETGTESEKELARMCQAHPTDPNHILKMFLTIGSVCSVGGAAAAAGCIYGITQTDQLPFQLVEGIGAAISGVLSAAMGYISYQAIMAASKFKHYSADKQFSENGAVFYTYIDQFTCDPTPAEIAFGHRVYPVNKTVSNFKMHSKGDYLFLGNVGFVQISHTFLNYFDSDTGISNENKENHKVIKLQFMQSGQKIIFPYRCSPENFQTKLFTLCDALPRSYLFKITEQEEIQLEKTYPIVKK